MIRTGFDGCSLSWFSQAAGPTAIVDQRRAPSGQSLDLGVAEQIGFQVEVHPALGGLGLGHGNEQQPGMAFLRIDEQRFGVVGSVGVLGVLDVAEHGRPEPGEGVVVTASDGDVEWCWSWVELPSPGRQLCLAPHERPVDRSVRFLRLPQLWDHAASWFSCVEPSSAS